MIDGEGYTHVGIMNGGGQTSVTEALYWVGSSKRDLHSLPDPVEDLFGYALYLAQDGKKHDQAKPLKGFGSAGVMEVVENWDRSTYRAVYTVWFEGVVFVLHVFQMKSTRGAATLKTDIDLIRERLKVAEQIAKELTR
jgi:phage-related protein